MSASVTETQTPETSASTDAKTRRRRGQRSSQVRSVLGYGEPLVWLTGGALVLSVVMIIGLLGLVFTLGFGTFRPLPLVEVTLRDGKVLMGEVTKTEPFVLNADKLLSESDAFKQPLLESLVAEVGDLSGLPAKIEEKEASFEAEIKSLDGRIAVVQERVDRLAANDKKPEATAFQRSTLIAGDKKDKDLQKARSDLLSLEGQRDALRFQVDMAQQAFEQFNAAEEITLETILNGDYSFQAIALDAMLGLVVQKKGEDSIKVRRRMLRTGNYELTNEHFNWVADYQIAEDGEKYPEAAVTVERVAWGRFYGSPLEFTYTMEREVDADEQKLADMLQFFQRNATSLEEADRAKLEAGLPKLKQQLVEVRTKSITAFVDDATKESSGQEFIVQFTTSTGELKAEADLTPEDDIVAAVVTWKGSEEAWGQFENLHHSVREKFHHRRHLEKHALGREYALQEHARLQLRQAELDYKLVLSELAQRLMQIETQMTEQQQDLQKAEVVLTQVQDHFGEQSPLASVANTLVDSLKQEAAASQAAPKQEREDLETQIASTPAAVQQLFDEYFEVERTAAAKSADIQAEIESLKQENARYRLLMTTADGQEKPLALGDVVRAYQANQLTLGERLSLYFSRWWEFLIDEPREANSEGGVLPAIWGTVTMTLIMSIAVVPFGVLAALYLREYAKSGPVVSAIRIAINNLAGVPSIVFGVFGLGFFCYIIGSYVDGGPANAGFTPLPPVQWYVFLGALAIFSLAAFLIGLIGFSGRHAAKSALRRVLSYVSIALWMASLGVFAYLLITTPFFRGFYEANLPNPYWGKGGVVWAALTLALMTLPVVIVATEEALSAVPNSMREGSYGCGASKWQTIRRIVLPQALPGIMTGMILAMARGAGEVAPLMLVGAVKLAPELPLDLTYPYLHGNRSFMHLGFHIFDVGFQSQNSEAAKPMVYTTTLLLIVIITILNLLAVWLRAYLRKRFVSGQF